MRRNLLLFTSAIAIGVLLIVNLTKVNKQADINNFSSLTLYAQTSPTTYSATGTVQTFTVPDCVTELTITAVGADGGNNSVNDMNAGGQGATRSGTVSVTPGDVLNIIVGQAGTTATRAGGGGGGSGVYNVTTSAVLIVAGGGGGGQDLNSGIGGGGGVGGTGAAGAGNRSGGGGGGASTNGTAGTTTRHGAGGVAGNTAGGAGGAGNTQNARGQDGGFGFGGGGGGGQEGAGGGGGFTGGNGGGDLSNVSLTTGGSSFLIASGTSITNTNGADGGSTLADGSVTIEWVVTPTPAAPTASVTVQPTCAVATGTIDVTAPANGTGITYTVTGTNPVVAASTNATGDFTGLAAGVYDVTTTNGDGCVSTATSLTVNAQPATPAAPTASVTVQPTCAVATGTIDVTAPANGTGITYTVTGTNPVVAASTNATGDFTGLAAGVYAVTTTNGDGCVSTAISLTVNAQPATPAAPTASVTVQPTCAVATGTIDVTAPANGTGITYTVTGTNPVVAASTNATGDFTGLAAGVYDVTTTNGDGCVSTATSLTVNAQPATPAAPTASVTVQPTCAVATGTIDVTAPANGTGITYTVTGTNPIVAASTNATGDFTGLAAGVYDVTTTNGDGCVSTATSLTVNAQPATPAAPTASVTVQPTCAVATGTIDVTAPANGTGITYTVTGTNPIVAASTNATGDFTGLAAGVYAVTTTNGDGCVSTATSLTVNAQPATPAAPTASVTVQPTCAVATGTIDVTAPANGTGITYTVTGTNPVVAASTNATGDFTGLAAGVYDVTTTNGDGCVSTATSLTVNAQPATPAAPTASVTVQPTCAVATGTIDVTAPANGTGITYTVTGTNPVVAASTNATGDFTGLAAGVYDVTTTNGDGCVSTATSLTVNAQPATPAAPTASVTVQPTCAVATGTIDVTAPANGTGITYTVTGTNPVVAASTNATGDFTGLAAGVYDVTTTNGDGCVSTATSLTVNAQPATPAAPTASVTVQPTCAVATGTIDVTAPANGTGITYTVTGTNPIVAASTNATGDFTGLAAGVYDVTTTNGDGCVSTATSLTVNAQPATPAAPTASVTVQPTCAVATGTIDVTAPANGTGITYTVTGTNPVVAASTNATGDFTGLAAGVYDVTTTNGDGCVSTATSLTVNAQPATPAAPTASVTVQPTCAVATGTIDVTAPANGTGITYTVTGTNPVVAASTNATGDFTGLAAGVYDVTTTNGDGCESTAISLTVNAQPATPAAPTASVTVQPTCAVATGTIDVTAPANGAGITYTLTGPSPAVTTVTNGTGDFTGLVAGDYEVTTTNGAGCVSPATELTVNAQPVTPSAPTIIRNDGTCTYSYQAANAGDTFNPATIPNGGPSTDPPPFSVIVTNTDGCSATFTVDPESCPAAGAFVATNTGTSGTGMFMVEDPCKCNGDQVLNADGTIAMAGTFSETVKVSGPANFLVRIKAATGIDASLPAALTETPIGSGDYEITFNHGDRVGYEIDEFEFSTDGGTTYNVITGASGLTPITISNVCAYPQIACATALPASMQITDAPITLGVNLVSVGSPTFTALPGYPIITVNDVAVTTFDPAASPAVIGNNEIIATYDFVSGSGANGDILNPAVPIDGDMDASNGVCPVRIIGKNITVISHPIPTMSQWGLLIFGLLILNMGIMLLYRKEQNF